MQRPLLWHLWLVEILLNADPAASVKWAWLAEVRVEKERRRCQAYKRVAGVLGTMRKRVLRTIHLLITDPVILVSSINDWTLWRCGIHCTIMEVTSAYEVSRTTRITPVACYA